MSFYLFANDVPHSRRCARRLRAIRTTAAAELAEVKQRAADASKDLSEKMAVFTKQLPAIKQTVTVLVSVV